MARTNLDLDRETKRQTILLVARELFTELGFGATSMGRIAERSKVAPNTLYWYFADKDELLLAVLDSVMADALAEYQKLAQRSFKVQLGWVLEQFASSQHLITEVHARMLVSERVRAWHDGFHRLFEQLIREKLSASGLDGRDVVHATQMVVFVIEGMLSHPMTTEARTAFVTWFTSRTVTPGRGDSSPKAGRRSRALAP